MGNDASKGKQSPPLFVPEEGKIKIDSKNLPTLQLKELNVPLPPPIKTKKMLKQQAEQEEVKSLILFNLKHEYDLNTYEGRFKQQVSRLNPLLFFTSDTQIKQAQEVLFQYKTRAEVATNLGSEVRLKQEMIDQIKQADKLVGGAVHPDTNEIIPFYMRLNGFVVFNCPILLVCLFARNQTPMFNAGMQLVNQTYNAGMNYGNRNASSSYTINDLMRGYLGAVVTSMTIALVSRKMLAKRLADLSGARLILAGAGLNYIAAALAGATNVTLMRFKELQEGINIQDENGIVTYGKSIVAGQRAIYETSLSRFVLPFPVLFFPALMNYLMESARIWPRNPFVSKLTEASLCIFSLTYALPMSIALYQTRSMISSHNLEKEFQEIKNEQGELIKHFYYNKGM